MTSVRLVPWVVAEVYGYFGCLIKQTVYIVFFLWIEVQDSDDLIVQLILAKVTEELSLFHHDFDINVLDVLHVNILLEILAHFWHTFEQLEPDVFPEHEAVNVSGSFVKECIFLVLRAIVGSDDGSIIHPKHIPCLSIDTVTNVYRALLQKNDLLLFLELREND